MGRITKKGQKGSVTNYISRTRALRKLQLSLADFRRLCILKGIHPHEPRNTKKLNKGSSAQRIYYHVKDIGFLAYEPLLPKFRESKVHKKRLRKALGKQDMHTAKRLEESEPVYALEHIVKERFPTFTDSLRDMDDCLSHICAFATLPRKSDIPAKLVHNCRRLMVEFYQYVVASRSLRKVYISNKGIYYGAEVLGQTVTWITPYQFKQRTPSDVDFKVMSNFTEFYQTMLEYINFALYHKLNMKYPPQIEGLAPAKQADPEAYLEGKIADFDLEDDEHRELLSALNHDLVKVFKQNPQEDDDDIDDELPIQLTPEEEAVRSKAKKEEEKLKSFKNMFSGFKFFLGREVYKETLTFILRSFGGSVSWDGDCMTGSTFTESDPSITHQIVDRPTQRHMFLSRAYVQPQWIFDCVNRCKVLPTSAYIPGASLPFHLSPFVEETEGDYIPPERLQELEEDICERTDALGENGEEDDHTEDCVEKEPKRRREISKEEEEEGESLSPKPKKSKVLWPVGSVVAGDVKKVAPVSKEEEERLTAEETRLSKMLLSKKKRRLYEQRKFTLKKQASAVRKLTNKRESYDNSKSKYRW